MSVTTAGASQRTTGILNLPRIIAASSIGTLVEWYDFYIYGMLAVFFAQHFVPPSGTAFIFTRRGHRVAAKR
jgi:hypothetical protein